VCGHEPCVLAAELPGLARVTVRRDSAGQSCTYTGAVSGNAYTVIGFYPPTA